jgi:hypothetical protein
MAEQAVAEQEDARTVGEIAFDYAECGHADELIVLLDEHPELDVNEFKDEEQTSTLGIACHYGHAVCAQLLIDRNADVNYQTDTNESALHIAAFFNKLKCIKLLVQNGADVNAQDNDGRTALLHTILNGRLPQARDLLEAKADVHYRTQANYDALYYAMCELATDRTPGVAFAFLSCNTDAKNVVTNEYSVTNTVRDAHIEEYKHVQAYIDEYHRILNLVLSEHVPVDPRFGLGQMGIYQEPLERTLEYLGLSMSKDQVVNTSIDGEGVKRVLIPGHLLNANHWFDKYKSR